jgi:hypothetical protein
METSGFKLQKIDETHEYADREAPRRSPENNVPYVHPALRWQKIQPGNDLNVRQYEIVNNSRPEADRMGPSSAVMGGENHRSYTDLTR